MRVLVVHNRYRSAQPSGENEAFVDEVEALREHGVEVHTLTVDSDAIATWSPARRMAVPLGVVWSRAGARSVAKATARSRADVVHFHNTFPLISPAGLRAARAQHVPVVQTLHNYRPLCPAGSLFRDGQVCDRCVGRLPLPAVRFGCYRDSRAATLPLAVSDGVHAAIGTWSRDVDAYTVPSQFARSVYVRAGWPAEKLVVKHNVVPDDGARADGPGHGFVCLTRFSLEKGLEVLLDAWGRAFPAGGEGLTMIGSGELEGAIRRRYDGMPGVRFTGQMPRSEAYAHVLAARALVVPSRWYEVFGRTAAEAAAAGVPAVVADIGGLPEVVEPEVTGLLFPAGSRDSLADALLRLARDDALCGRLGVAARERYERLFTPEATTRGLIEVYDRITGAPPRVRAAEGMVA
jgi:glycosyltransferase involved in cell wall biosynthesis